MVDADSDGLVDAAERVIGTSTGHKGSDGDGISTADADEHGAEVVARLPLRFQRG